MAFQIPKPKKCEDCGDGAVFHKLTYVTIALDEAIWSVFPPQTGKKSVARGLSNFERAISPSLFRATTALGIAKKQVEPDDETLLLALCIWNEAKVRGIEMWEWRLFGLARNMFFAQLPSGKQITFEGIPSASYEDDRVWWMDDKARLKEEFKKHGLPVAKGGAARTEKEARALFGTLEAPVIVKPHSGSGSRHTILHITTEAELVRAFHIAKLVSPKVIVEEELVGPVYRATVVDGKFAAALRRDPPAVVGDGVHTIRELVEEENKKPGRSGPYFSKIEFNDEAADELRWQGLTFESIPPEGKRVYFHQKVNWSLGGTTSDVTDDVHPDNVKLFEWAARELVAPVVGLDFIIKDINKSWKEQDRCGILECNSMPFFDNHHLPFDGKPRNVAGAIWDMVTPKDTIK